MNGRLFANPTCRIFIIGGTLALSTSSAWPINHLLISEVFIGPSAGEFIEIVNRTGATIDLSNYYLTDFGQYWRTSQQVLQPPTSDFIVRFPAGATIPNNGVAVVAIKANNFQATYGFAATYELPPNTDAAVPDMLPTYGGSIGIGPSFNESGEACILFFWNGTSDLVKDVDLIRVGIPPAGNDIQNKTGLSIDGLDPDAVPTMYLPDAFTMPTMGAAAGVGFSHKRRFEECGHEIFGGGNGLFGDDETSENIAITWDGSGVAFTAPTPGVVPSLPADLGCGADIAPAGLPPGDGVINVEDLLAVIGGWGLCIDPGNCPADIAPCGSDEVVNVSDLLAVIGSWGPCS